MQHLSYVAIMAACLVGTLPLEIFLGARVYARWPRLLAVLTVVVVIFGGWDVLAIRAGHWDYAGDYLVGVTLPGRLPLEELLFFLVIPTCSVLTLEAVRRQRPHWFL